MEISFSDFITCLFSGLSYLPVTIKMAVVSIIIATVLSIFVAIIQYYKVPVISQILTIVVTVYQGIPFIVSILIYQLLFLIYFNDVAAFFHSSLTVNDVSSIYIGYFAMTLGAMTGLIECFRGALKSVPKIQFEAAASVGMTTWQGLRRIILPQMFPVAFPSYMSNIISVIKGIPLLSAIGILEVMQGSLIPCAVNYSYIEGYIAVAVIYLVFIGVLTIVLEIIEKKVFVHQQTAGSL